MSHGQDSENCRNTPRPAPVNVIPTRVGYDRWAEVYDDDGNPLIALEERHFSRLVGDVRGMDVLDLGCGTGRQSAAMVRAGARVTAVDFSEGMASRAAERPEWPQVRFVGHDLAKPLPFDDRSFDRVICCLVLDHIHDLDTLFHEMARLCRHDGRIVISSMHPAMMLRGVMARFNDPQTGEKVHVRSATNQVSDYVMAAVRAGLRIEHLSEHAADESLAAAYPRAVPHLGWTMLLLMVLRPG